MEGRTAILMRQVSRRPRQAVHRKLLRHGFLVRKVRGAAHGWPNGQAFWTPTYIQRLGFHPATVIDAGVGPGTPDIYEAFPDSYLVLVEPVEEFFFSAHAVLAKRAGILIPAALGSGERMQTMFVEPRQPQGSSFSVYDPKTRSRDWSQRGDAAIPRSVEVTSLDALIAKHAWQPPFGLKIDTQGSELEIIRGATRFLSQTEFVIAEVNLIDRYPGSYSFAEFIAALDQAGFRVCDILDITRTPTSEVKYVDLVFRRKPV